MRTVCWFSAGAASAVATKLILADTADVVIAYIDPGSEHQDNVRFRDDCARWFGADIVTLRSERYVDTWAVWEDRRFIVSNEGAPCTGELKRAVRHAFSKPDDVHVFGYTIHERHRTNRLDVEAVRFPLIDAQLTKSDCLAIIEQAGIELPAMYRLGFANANCIGCPKGGMGYWNRIRRVFPATFARMATLERTLGYAIHSDSAGPVFLDELDPERGRDEAPRSECSLFCSAIDGRLADDRPLQSR